MSPFLSDLLTKPPRLSQPFILFQSSAAQSNVPILRDFINNRDGVDHTLLFSFLYPPSHLVTSRIASLRVYDRLAKVPEYTDDSSDHRTAILSAISEVPSGSLDVIIDSVDTLTSDLGSISHTYQFLRELISQIRDRSDSSRLVLHLLSPCELIALLVQSTFSVTLTHVIAHPPALLAHLAKAYFILPPPASPPEIFWKVFLPFSERVHESNRLVFGPEGEGCGGGGAAGTWEIVVQVLVRDVGDRSGRRRVADRAIQAWSNVRGACEPTDLECLKCLLSSNLAKETVSELPQDLTFNLNLTSSQQQSRAQVPLPYAHEGKVPVDLGQNASPAIYYDPDSADDMDDEDPDEDLDF